MNNLEIYNEVRAVPAEAQKAITGGRLKGMTDINPMWRIKSLTEQFGPCGVGWKYTIKDKRLEKGENGEVAAFVDIDLFYLWEGSWSEAVAGTGGAMFVTKESKGHYTDDECFKKALTDAISVACKALGFGADVYWSKDKTKYDGRQETPNTEGMLTSECFRCKASVPVHLMVKAKNNKTGAMVDLCPECAKAAGIV